jgi:transposase
MSRLYGRATGNHRAKGYTHFHPGQRTTLIGALSCQGFKAGLFGPWYMDGSIFLTFIQKNLVPRLTPGEVVVMDNLSAHKVKGVKEAIEATGARLLYLSPDLSPIELAWSKIKNSLRTPTALTPKKLHRVIFQVFRSVSNSDSLGGFYTAVTVIILLVKSNNRGDPELVNLLLKHGADVHAYGKNDNSHYGKHLTHVPSLPLSIESHCLA